MNQNDTRFTSNNNKSTFLSSYLASDDEEDNLENFGQTNDNSERLEILAPIPLNIPNTIENGHHNHSIDTASCSSSSAMNSSYNQINDESYLNIWNDNDSGVKLNNDNSNQLNQQPVSKPETVVGTAHHNSYPMEIFTQQKSNKLTTNQQTEQQHQQQQGQQQKKQRID